MDYTSTLLNTEVRENLTRFIQTLIEINQVPVYMVKNLLLEAVYNLNIKEQEEYQKAVEEYRKQQASTEEQPEE